MKIVYKYILAVLFLFTVYPSFAVSADKFDVADFQAQMMDELDNVEQNNVSLYSFVRHEMEKYYGRKDFSDPEHNTGWYRIDDFLNWLKNNEQILQDAVINFSKDHITLRELYNKQKIKQEQYYYLFWTYLGSRYIANVYGINSDFEDIVFSLACTNYTMFGVIYMCPNDKRAYPSIVNIGIHETSHLLPYLKDKLTFSLSELVTFYSIYNYGLPVKSSDATSFIDGIRDIRRTAAFRPDLDFLPEYHHYMAGLVLNSQISPKDIFLLKDAIGDIGKTSIAASCFNLVALKKHKFFANLKHDMIMSSLPTDYLTEQESNWLRENRGKKLYIGDKNFSGIYVQNAFVEYDKRDTYATIYSGGEPTDKQKYFEIFFKHYSTPELRKFYSDIYNKFPKNFIRDVKENVLAQTGSTCYELKCEQIMNKYSEDIKKIILQTLEEKSIPQAKIPEGYI